MNITVQEFEKALHQKKRDKVLFLDVRTPEEHVSERIPEVHNIPLHEIENHIDDIRKYDAVYIHCQSGRRSKEAQDILTKHGIHSLHVEGGIAAWQSSGKKILRPKGSMPIMQQVLAIAGILVLLGVTTAYVINDGFLIIPLAVGIGLTYAGLSGHCLMAYMLAKMPWNRTTRRTLPWE